MRLKSLHIENFRSINKLDIELPQVCGTVGPNNAGKTNLLEAIRRVLGHDQVTSCRRRKSTRSMALQQQR